MKRIQEMLALRSKQGKFFSRICNLLRSKRLWKIAVDKVLSNKGSRSPGIDGKTRKHYQEEGQIALLISQITGEIRVKSYRPQPVRRVYIPKSSNEKRPLGIPTIRDRVIQEALRLILEPIFETKFHPHSYGFRPFRSTHHASSRLHFLIGNRSFNWVVEGDIAKCFDRIDHDILLSLLKKHIKNRRILKLIRLMLKAGVMEDLQWYDTEKGSPQGGIISPLLANIYLHELDNFIAAKYENLSFSRRKRAPLPLFICRYADDFVILVKGTKDQAEAVKEEVAFFLRDKLKLELSEAKTLVTPVEQGFDFLGFNIRKYQQVTLVKPSKKAMQKLRDKVKRITKEYFSMDINLGLMELNYALRGFGEYYRRVSAKEIFAKLDHFIWWHVLRRAKRFITGKNTYPTRQFYKSHYFSYSKDVFRMNRRFVNSRNFGVWSPEKNRAWIVQALKFYPIQYVNNHCQLNPYIRHDYAQLEAKKALNRLLSDLAKYPLSKHL